MGLAEEGVKLLNIALLFESILSGKVDTLHEMQYMPPV